MPSSPTRSGLLAGVGAYVLWGVLPLYFPLLQPPAPVEIVAHRVVWSLRCASRCCGVTRTWRPFLDTSATAAR